MYFAALVVLVLLPLAGCGSSSTANTVSKDGYKLTVKGNVATDSALKSTLKSLFATGAPLGTLDVIDAQSGISLLAAPATIDAGGAFSNLSLTLTNAKTVLVFKAVVTTGTFRSVVPVDLSTPPAAGISASNAITIAISPDTTNIATTVSTMLGLAGVLGDTGATLTSVSKTYTDAVLQVVNNGGQVLAYNTSGPVLTGSVSSAALLPAASATTFSFDDLNNIVLDGKILSAFVPGKKPIVNFQITNKATGKGISGLKTFGLHVAKLMPESNGSNSYWVNYIDAGIATLPGGSAVTKPGADTGTSYNTNGSVKVQGYTVIDHGDGTYTATFANDITSNINAPFDATLTHRVGITVSTIAVPGVTATGPINPATGAPNASFSQINNLAMAYDFTPLTGAVLVDANSKPTFARDLVTVGACESCHYKITKAASGGGESGGHTGSRPSPRICVMCHTSKNTAAEGEFINLIHRVHMGEKLNEGGSFTLPTFANGQVGRVYVTGDTLPAGKNIGDDKPLVSYGEQTYPQDIRNCTLCHQGTDVDAWKAKASRKACGSCHNAVNFAAGTNHGGGAQASDANCTGCHAAGGVFANHLPIAKPDPLNAVSVYAGAPYSGVFSSYSAAYQANGRVAPGTPNSNTNAAYTVAASLSRLPVGAKMINYVISEVGRNASSQPYIKFKFQVATADANGVLGTPVDVVFNTSDGTNEMITGFVGSPSIYFAFAVPQDGIIAPADYNATVSVYLKRVWDGTVVAKEGAAKAATLSAPASGVYTLAMTGVTIPDSAVMLTGGIGYTYGLGSVMTKIGSSYVPFATTTIPLTQIDLPAYPYSALAGTPVGIGGLSVPADNKWKVATKGAPDAITGIGVVAANSYAGRRVIVDNAKCNKCHGRLGVNPTFHAGQRNDAPTCTFCHNVNRVNSGWGVNIKDAVHAIHGANKRVNKFSWEATAGAKYWNVTYPGYLRNCEECHLTGMYDFSNSVYTANNGSIFDSMLYTTAASGKAINGTSVTASMVILTGSETIPASGTAVVSPFIDPNTAYGAIFSFNATAVGGANGTAITKADGSKVTNTPQLIFNAEATTLVNSPIAAACAGCHDTKVARAHMSQFGGSISKDRTTALGTKETCIICHGVANNSFNSTVPTIKASHRWW
jgi:OmcA/MtrC family decaheme c-type cytochrome